MHSCYCPLAVPPVECARSTAQRSDHVDACGQAVACTRILCARSIVRTWSGQYRVVGRGGARRAEPRGSGGERDDGRRREYVFPHGDHRRQRDIRIRGPAAWRVQDDGGADRFPAGRDERADGRQPARPARRDAENRWPLAAGRSDHDSSAAPRQRRDGRRGDRSASSGGVASERAAVSGACAARARARIRRTARRWAT